MDNLGIEKATALGHLQMFWWWCIDYALDGQLIPNPAQLARAADWKGDANVFAEAMLSSGWIDEGNGCWMVHDWHEYCGELVEKRLERKVLKKIKAGQKRRTKTAEVPTNPDKNPPTVPNRTVPYTTKPKEKEMSATIAAPPGEVILPADPQKVTPHIRFVEGFKSIYQRTTGAPFKIDKQHWVIAARLVNDYGYEECVKKVRVLSVLCQKRSAWFTKDGPGSFTLETLSSKWNSIIPETVPETKENEVLAEIRKREEMRVRGDSIIANGSSKDPNR